MPLEPDSANNPERVIGAHRGQVDIALESGHRSFDLHGRSATLGLTVGDRVTVDIERSQITQHRRAGAGYRVQRRYRIHSDLGKQIKIVLSEKIKQQDGT